MPHPTDAVEVSIADRATPGLVQALGRLLPQLSSSAPPLTQQALMRVVDAPSNLVLIARDPLADGRIIGTLTLVVFPIPTAIRAWIEDVVVDEAARGRGAGEALVGAAVKLAFERGARTLDLTSRSSRRASHRLYEKCGFHVRDSSVYRFGPKPQAPTA
jgi:ribosomal protein S18 acetylase RimI-like enzyme